MDAYTQDQRRLQIDTVLGRDHVLLVAARGRDTMSQFFSYDLEIASLDDTITADKLLGTAITFRIHDGKGDYATINGLISHFTVLGHQVRELSLYRLRVVPALWFLTQTSDCRIFQEKTVPEIVDQILGDFGVKDKEWRLSGEHEARDYCVQYRETAYDFICRLLEEEGIFFYFRHEDKGHTVVFSDHNHGLTKCTESHVPMTPVVGAVGHIWQWDSAYRFRPGEWALSDYNFETPSTNLTTRKKTINPILEKQSFERFDYPGRYLKKNPGETLTKLRIEYEEAAFQEITGESACVAFAAGTIFSISNPDARGAGAEYVIRSVEHDAEDWNLVTLDAKPSSYSNRFCCALTTVPFRPERKTPAPRIHGTQTAVVTGPAGTEIFTDKYGRIKVQFFWDRQGKKDEHSSCWVRVAQSWAGRTFGTWFVPRIGQEVVIAFLEGDPDRPLVVGSVYNAEQMVPFALPANATQSGVRTRSSLNGSPANVNEFRFEDRKGSEQIYLHAERDHASETEHDETHWVGHDETTTVDNDRTELVRGNETITIDKNRTETVHGNETITVDKNRTETVHLNETLTIDKNRTHTVQLSDTLTVGVARLHTVGAAEAISVGAARAVTVGASQTITVGSNQTITVGGSETTSIGKDRSTSVAKNESLEVGKSITISAGDEIVLKTGSATITMKKNGDITIEGKQITIKGSGDVIIKGQKILQN